MFGVMLRIPVPQLKKIKSSCQGDIELCKIDMLQYWLDNTLVPKWNDVILALEETDQVALASQIKHAYLSSTTDSEEEGMVIVLKYTCYYDRHCSRIKCYFTSYSS